MLLKKITLENIRSHVLTEIEFPLGKTLLAGDIGCGKSSILLGIDFALFGLMKGVLSGNALLRNGKGAGRVQLEFEIDENSIVLERVLKKTAAGVSQDTGSISINGERVEKSAVELKQAVLELLHYPGDLLSKSKGLMYRYTVYTPQEEMKQILMAEADERLDTLRRVFGIDKYKRIQENGELFLKLMREKRKMFAVQIADLEEKKKERASKQEGAAILKNEILELETQLKSVQEKLRVVEKQLGQFEERKGLQQSTQHALSMKQAEIRHLLAARERNLGEEERLQREIERLQLEVVDWGDEELDYRVNVRVVEQEVQHQDLEYRRLLAAGAASLAEKNHLQDVVDKIARLDVCPTCNQKVTAEHKHKLLGEEEQRLLQLGLQVRELESRKVRGEEELSRLKQQLESLRALEKKQEISRLKKEHLAAQKTRLLRLEEEDASNHEKKAVLEQEAAALQLQLEGISLEGYEGLQEELTKLRLEEPDINGEWVAKKRDLQHLGGDLQRLESEILEKERIQHNVERLASLHQWMDEFFLEMTRMMERKVMAKVNMDFNGYFQKWFEMLVGGENLEISVGEGFSPRILQDGYDLEYGNLSGGEKTAVALAYRLALNQVINNLASEIKTRDVLILDEPTDGFSDEQLERMKSVLDELKIQQIILVSHEEKIESFVQHVIRLRKEGHVTRIG